MCRHTASTLPSRHLALRLALAAWAIVGSASWARAQQCAAETTAGAEPWRLAAAANEIVIGQGWAPSIRALELGAPPYESMLRYELARPLLDAPLDRVEACRGADAVTAGFRPCEFLNPASVDESPSPSAGMTLPGVESSVAFGPGLPLLRAPELRAAAARFGSERPLATPRYFAALLTQPRTSYRAGDFENLGPGRRAFLSPADAAPAVAAGGRDRNAFNLSAGGRAADAPPGTMFIWSFARAATGGDGPSPGDSHTSDARPGSSAGLVLSRPLGLYSLDWVGVAFTATIH